MEVLGGNSPVSFVSRCRKSDGSYLWILWPASTDPVSALYQREFGLLRQDLPASGRDPGCFPTWSKDGGLVRRAARSSPVGRSAS